MKYQLTPLGWGVVMLTLTGIVRVGIGVAANIHECEMARDQPQELYLPSYLPQDQAAPEVERTWHRTSATFYGDPYDDGKRRVCADGKTVYTSKGRFCATRLVPLGSTIEVKRGDVTLTLLVADTQAKRYGHLIDLPTQTWDELGMPRRAGKVPVQWRKK